MSLYERLKYAKKESDGLYNWLGNLRWYVTENESGRFSFRCISALKDMTHEECVAINTTKELFAINLLKKESDEWVYGVDYIQTKHIKIMLPFHEYGAYICADTDMQICFEGNSYDKDGICVIQNGAYYICLCFEKAYCNVKNQIIVNTEKPQWVAVTYHIDEAKAIANCKRMATEREKIIADNRVFWEDYLASCPTVELEKDYVYKHESLNIEECYSPESFVTRQLWHYQCLLMNVCEVEFNKLPVYMAPDRIHWIGTWSNDGPQCMAILSLTNQKELAKRIIIQYLKHAMTIEGEFSWYMHADGTGCYNVQGDVGRFSHGDPYMPHVVEYYIRNTGDESILLEDVGGVTVYEKLRIYMLNLHDLRDMNQDSMIEWSNLWETGWDDKGGTFFTSTSLEEWMEVVANGTEDEIVDFYKEHQHPVIAVVEQVIALWSFKAMAKLAKKQEDKELETYCEKMFSNMKLAVETRCWNEDDQFYYDIDVKSNTQTTEKSADAFYWLNFEDNMERAAKLVEHLNDDNEFNCYYVPMLSKDSIGFNQFGYWSGGHWPREMSIIAMGLHHCGFDDKAMELLVRAIMSEEGNIIAEVIEPLEGKRSTKIMKMACAVMNPMALLDITDKVKWCCGD